MPLAAYKKISTKDLILLDLVQTGEGAQMMGVLDRRTFISWAKRLGIEPAASLGGGDVAYHRRDAERIAAAYKAFQKTKRGK